MYSKCSLESLQQSIITHEMINSKWQEYIKLNECDEKMTELINSAIAINEDIIANVKKEIARRWF